MDDFFISDFSLDCLNPGTNNQEFTPNNETPIFKSCTIALVNNQENQAQIMENQTTHYANQFMLQQTMMNQPVTHIPHHQEEENKSENENLSYAKSMKNLSVIFLPSSDYDSHTKLIVRRRRVWNDSNETLKRFIGVNIKHLKTDFVGEEAVDEGGPLREFFSLIFEGVQKHIMTGGNNSFTFLYDVRKLGDGYFFRFGQLIAFSLLHDCPGPRKLVESVAKHMLEFQSFTVPSIKTVPDFELQTKPTEINDCDNEEKFQRLLDNFPERFYFGVTKLRLTLENKQNFIHNILYHCCISSCIKELKR